MEATIEIESIIITEHAYLRAKERLSLNHKSFYKLATKAYKKGIKHSDTKGSLNKYIASIWFKYKNASNVRIFGENIFLFNKNVLITVYQVPNEFKRLINKISKCK